jgi:hypothetical protein
MRAVGLLFLVALAIPTNVAELFPFGTHVGDTKLAESESSSPSITLQVPIKYYDDVRKTVFVSINGVLSFEEAFGDFASGTELKNVERTAIAAFFAKTVGGNVYYRFVSLLFCSSHGG